MRDGWLQLGDAPSEVADAGIVSGRAAVVIGSTDGAVGCWDLAAAVPVGEPFQVHDGGPAALAVATFGQQSVVAVGGEDGTVQVWDLIARRPVGPMVRHRSRVTAVALAALNGRLLVISGGSDRTVRLWDAVSGEPTAEVTSLQDDRGGGPIVIVARQYRGQAVVSTASDNGNVHSFDPVTALPVWEPIGGHEDYVATAALGSIADLDGLPVAVWGGTNGDIQLFDLPAATPIGDPMMEDQGDFIAAIAIGELAGHSLVASGSDDAIRIIDLWDDSQRVVSAPARISRLFFGPDGAFVVCADDRWYTRRLEDQTVDLMSDQA